MCASFLIWKSFSYFWGVLVFKIYYSCTFAHHFLHRDITVSWICFVSFVFLFCTIICGRICDNDRIKQRSWTMWKWGQQPQCSPSPNNFCLSPNLTPDCLKLTRSITDYISSWLKHILNVNALFALFLK